MENNANSAESKDCMTCNETFYRPARYGTAKWAERKYCSRACQPHKEPGFIPCRICGEPSKYRGNENSSLAGMVRCSKPECKEASRLLKNAAISGVAKQMYADGERGLSPEIRQQISEKLTGRVLGPYSEERVRVLTEALNRPEVRAKLSAAGKGRIMPPLSEEQKARLRAMFLGRKHTEETKAKMAISGKGRFQSDEKRRKISERRKGIRFPDAHKAKLSAAAKARCERGDSPHFSHISKLEKRAGLFLMPLGFIPQFRFGGNRHPYDFGHVELKIIVEVNGCYWHSHGCIKSNCGEKPKIKDAHNAQHAAQAGYTVIVLWQCQEQQWPDILRGAGLPIGRE